MSAQAIGASAQPLPAEMTVAVLDRPLALRLEQRPLPTPGPGEVLIQIRAVGVCGSDVHFWQSGRIGDFVVRAPLVLGHESAGVVAKVGPDVTSLRPGDRVALEPGVPCRKCDACRTGHYNLCPDVVFMATPPIDGTFAQYFVHPADFAYKLPDNVCLDEGALLEPLSVGIHAVRRADLRLGQTVLVTGSGPIGLTALLAAKAAGASRVYVSDVVTSRLDVARQLGATDVIDVRDKDLASEIARLTSGAGVDVVIECSGAAPVQTAAIGALKRGGVLALVGLGGNEVVLSASAMNAKEIDVRGVFRYSNTYPTAVELVASGQVNLKPLVTHHFALTDIEQAMETAHSRIGGAIKVIVCPAPSEPTGEQAGRGLGA